MTNVKYEATVSFREKKIEKQEVRVRLRVYKYSLVHLAARVGDKYAKVGQSRVATRGNCTDSTHTRRERHSAYL